MKFAVNKTMRTLSFYCLGLILIFLSSCDPANKYSAEIESIDSCLVVLDELEEKQSKIEYDSLDYMVKHIAENEAVIKALYQPDTLSIDFGRKMNDCKGVRKSLKDAGKSKDLYSLEIDQLKTQFINLKNDIENGVLKDEQLKEYLEIEKKDLSVLTISFNAFYDLQESQKSFFYNSCPSIDDFVAKLKNEAQVQ